MDVARQAITQALHDVLLNSDQAKDLRKLIKSTEDAPSPSTPRKDTPGMSPQAVEPLEKTLERVAK
jgi:hypothetical protein